MFMEQFDCGFTHGAYIECNKNLVFNSYILWIDTTWILKTENKKLYDNSHFFGLKTPNFYFFAIKSLKLLIMGNENLLVINNLGIIFTFMYL
jgi:hypothetical protein